MKRIFSLLLMLLLIVSIAACSKTETTNKNLDGSLESILAKIYASDLLGADFKNNTVPGLVTTTVTTDRNEYYLGKADLQYKEAIASEHTFSTAAYSLVLVRVKDGENIETFKSNIKNNVDPFKWVCVGVDENNIIVDNIGDVVILIMSNYEAQNLQKAFLALKK